MQVKQETWTVAELVAEQSNINLNPSWQRGPAWKLPRQVLLIDSILRGMDIPKIYLRKLSGKSAHSHDAVDGQQRLRSIWNFRSGIFSLENSVHLPSINGHEIAGKDFDNLHSSLKARFDAFEVGVAEITNARSEEITDLFSRLQMGVSLNPAELRNAMHGPMRHVIDSIATSHQFFQEAKISSARHKRQDYVTHAIAMAVYDGNRDIKAADLKAMVQDYGPEQSEQVRVFFESVSDALGILASVNKSLNFYITQKWIFVDLCWLVMQWRAENYEIDTAILAQRFCDFENLRRFHNHHPEELLGDNRPVLASKKLNRHLHDYIVAFRAQGGTHTHLKIRNAALRAFLD